jgi:hypothetical protein
VLTVMPGTGSGSADSKQSVAGLQGEDSELGTQRGELMKQLEEVKVVIHAVQS